MVDRERIELSISGCKPDVFPLALTAQITYYLSHCTPQVKARYGPSREIRTPDPLVPNQMRYQTALYTDKLAPEAGIEPATN